MAAHNSLQWARKGMYVHVVLFPDPVQKGLGTRLAWQWVVPFIGSTQAGYLCKCTCKQTERLKINDKDHTSTKQDNYKLNNATVHKNLVTCCLTLQFNDAGDHLLQMSDVFSALGYINSSPECQNSIYKLILCLGFYHSANIFFKFMPLVFNWIQIGWLCRSFPPVDIAVDQEVLSISGHVSGHCPA